MSQKVAWITGASTGIGEELARQLAAKSYRLSLLARRKELLEKLAEELRAKGAEVLCMEGDVRDMNRLQEVVTETEAALGPIDLVIANAGISSDLPVRRFSASEARKIYEVNVIGLMQTIAAVLPLFLERDRGHIVGVSSLASYISLPRSAVYCSSKAAVSSFLEGLRLELLPTQVKVTTLCPGFIHTPLTAKNKFKMPFVQHPPEAVAKMVKAIEDVKPVWNDPMPLYAMIRTAQALPDFIKRTMAAKLR